MTTTWPAHCYNIVTHLQGRMDGPQRKNCSDDQYKTSSQPTGEHSQLSGNAVTRSQRNRPLPQDTTERRYNQHARPLPDITVGSHVAIQNQETKRWDRYGTVVDVSKYRRYFIKMSNGRILVRNRRFMRRRVPISVPPTPHHEPNLATPGCQQPIPRRSSRTCRPTRRLIEEIHTCNLQAEV